MRVGPVPHPRVTGKNGLKFTLNRPVSLAAAALGGVDMVSSQSPVPRVHEAAATAATAATGREHLMHQHVVGQREGV